MPTAETDDHPFDRQFIVLHDGLNWIVLRYSHLGRVWMAWSVVFKPIYR